MLKELKILKNVANIIGTTAKAKVIAGVVAGTLVVGGTTTAVVVHHNTVIKEQRNNIVAAAKSEGKADMGTVNTTKNGSTLDKESTTPNISSDFQSTNTEVKETQKANNTGSTVTPTTTQGNKQEDKHNNSTIPDEHNNTPDTTNRPSTSGIPTIPTETDKMNNPSTPTNKPSTPSTPNTPPSEPDKPNTPSEPSTPQKPEPKPKPEVDTSKYNKYLTVYKPNLPANPNLQTMSDISINAPASMYWDDGSENVYKMPFDGHFYKFKAANPHIYIFIKLLYYTTSSEGNDCELHEYHCTTYDNFFSPMQGDVKAIIPNNPELHNFLLKNGRLKN